MTEQQLMDALVSLKKQFNRIPSKEMNRKYGQYNSATYQRRFGSWNNALLKIFGTTLRTKSNRKTVLCKLCKKETQNSMFCSKSCANIYSPKRKKTAFCFYCGDPTKSIPRSGKRKCRKCFQMQNITKLGEKKISDFSSTHSRHQHQNVRNHAHRVARFHGLKRVCEFCGYDKHVQLCHKKSIASFPPSTRLSVVNDLSNLSYLCPSHHWELDNGMLSIHL